MRLENNICSDVTSDPPTTGIYGMRREGGGGEGRGEGRCGGEADRMYQGWMGGERASSIHHFLSSMGTSLTRFDKRLARIFPKTSAFFFNAEKQSWVKLFVHRST